MAVVAVICARGGSKGIPRKNVRPFHGHPLIVWTIRAALACTRIEHVVLSSDDDEILAVAEAAGALPHRRPAELATDEAGTEPCVIDVLEHHPEARGATTVVLLQATSPLTRSEDLEEALAGFSAGGFDSLLSVVDSHVFQWAVDETGAAKPLNYDPASRPRRQELEGRVAENGAFYIASRAVWNEHACRLGGRVGVHLMRPWQGWEIDTEDDWRRLEILAEDLGLKPA